MTGTIITSTPTHSVPTPSTTRLVTRPALPSRGPAARWLTRVVAAAVVWVGAEAAPAAAQQPARAPVDAAERALVERRQVEASFPRLKHTEFEVLRPSSQQYNCIGWALGTSIEWVWPGESVAEFDRLTAAFGYQRAAALDYRVQPGVKKALLYGKKVKGEWHATHMARQMSDGTWTSKLGQMPLIRHGRPDDLNGPSYGQPIVLYVRAAR